MVKQLMNDGKSKVTPEQIAAFLATVDLSVRKPEKTELVDGDDAIRYNHACDYPENSDYGLVVEALKAGPGVDGKSILEIGLGPGNLCGELCRANAKKVIGVDPSLEMVAHVKEKFADELTEVAWTKQGHWWMSAQMEVHQESVYSLPAEFSSAFDLVVCQNTFHQLYNPLSALDGMVKAAKPGGEVHIFDFRRDIPLELLAGRIAYTKPEIWEALAQSVGAAISKSEFENLLRQIPGIEFSVANALNPSELSDRARKLIELDPVPHHLDYLISQKVVIYKK